MGAQLLSYHALSDTERKYAQIEKEAFTLTWGCEHFQSYLVGMDFLLQTDHKQRLGQIRTAQDTDDVCNRLKHMVTRGWLLNRKSFYVSTPALLADRLLMKGDRLVTPITMQEEMLNKIHEGHQDMTKCAARAQQSLLWPGLTKQIKRKMENYAICAREVHNAPEPLLTTPLPVGPWQRVAADLFQWDNACFSFMSLSGETSSTKEPIQRQDKRSNQAR